MSQPVLIAAELRNLLEPSQLEGLDVTWLAAAEPIPKGDWVAIVPLLSRWVGGTELKHLPKLRLVANVAVFKSPTCGCCAKWVEHLRTHGFAPTTTNIDDMEAVKTKYGVPKAAHSCHTATVNGYVIEGHVPAADIQRLLKDRPAVAGLAAPGMPMGSPGMESPHPEKYNIVSFDKTGKTRVFAAH